MGTGTARRTADRSARPSRAPARGPRSPFRPRWPGTRRGRTAAVAVIAVAVLGAALAVVVLLTPVLDVRGVSVALDRAPRHGDHRLTEAEIVRAAAVPRGGPLARADLGAIRSRVDRLPRVADVTVSRAWPHTVRISVTEHRAVAVLRSGTGYAEVDARGHRFDTVARPPKGVPEIRMDPAQPRSAVFSDAELLRGAVAVAGDLPAGVRSRARWVHVNSYDGITVRLRVTGGHAVVRWGSPEQGRAKAAALSALLKKDRSAGSYDVTAPGAPALS